MLDNKVLYERFKLAVNLGGGSTELWSDDVAFMYWVCILRVQLGKELAQQPRGDQQSKPLVVVLPVCFSTDNGDGDERLGAFGEEGYNGAFSINGIPIILGAEGEGGDEIIPSTFLDDIISLPHVASVLATLESYAGLCASNTNGW